MPNYILTGIIITMSMLTKLINEILRNNSFHYTVARIAKECSLSESTIRQIKSGKIKQPRYNTTLRLFSLYLSVKDKTD
jgi:predicted transcriptional regulator